MRIRNIIILSISLFLFPNIVIGANYYIRPGATGTSNGSDWSNAYVSIPSTLVRGSTYYLADGTYNSYTFDDAESGTSVITVKKATVADHGTNTGWNESYGDGQAIFTGPIRFDHDYYVLDGNRTHTIPSTNTNDYGIKIDLNTGSLHSGYIQIGNPDASHSVQRITVRYVHAYNAHRDEVNDDTIAVRFRGQPTYIKLQNSYFQNCTTDGIQMADSKYILLERNVFEKLGKRHDPYHGQTLQSFYGAIWEPNFIVVRWNKFINNEGQALWSIARGVASEDRFYGNVIYNKYGDSGECVPSSASCTTGNWGFNVSGGIIGASWGGYTGPSGEQSEVSKLYVYNNTIVNIRQSLTGNSETTNTDINITATYPIVNNVYHYNDLYYNSESSTTDRSTGNGYHATGGYGTVDGMNPQTGLSSSIFVNYTGNNFALASATNAGLVLTIQPWWNDGSDAFFGQMDYSIDMAGNTRGADGVWDRGAFEFTGVTGVRQPFPPGGVTIAP